MLSQTTLRTFGRVGIALFFACASCINADYDLKNINKDITIGTGGISLPVGNTEPIRLSQLIEPSDMIMIEDGQYVVRKKGIAEETRVTINPVVFSLNSFKVDPMVADFSAKSIGDMVLDDQSQDVSLVIPSVDFNLHSFGQMTHSRQVTGPAFPSKPVYIDRRQIEESAAVACRFECRVPERVARINRVLIGSESGQRMTFNLDLSSIASGMSASDFQQRIVRFELAFPDGFVLQADPDFALAGYTSVSGNKLVVADAPLIKGLTRLPVSFILKSYDKTIPTGLFSLDDWVRYSFQYEFSGTTTGVSSTPAMGVSFVEQPVYYDADIQTNEFGFQYPETSFVFKLSVEDLEDITRIRKVEFEQTELVIDFSLPDFPMTIKQGGSMAFELPDFIDYRLISATSGVSLVGKTLLIPADRMMDAHVKLGLLQADLSGFAIKDNRLVVEREIPGTGSNLVLNKNSINERALRKLSQSVLNWKLTGGVIQVKSAEVETTGAQADIDTRGVFNLREVVPQEVVAIHTIAPKKGTTPKMNFRLDFSGNLPSEIEWLMLENVQVRLPDFVQLRDDRFQNQVLTLNGRFDVRTGYRTSVEIAGFDFRSFNAGEGLIPFVEDGQNRIEIAELNEVVVSGVVRTGPVSVNLGELGQIIITPSVSVDEFALGLVKGFVRPEIDPVEEVFLLELGKELEFLKEDAELNLHNPQVCLQVGNSMGVPVDVSLSMVARDESGAEIEGSAISGIGLKLLPATSNGSLTHTNVLISRQPTVKKDYVNVVVPGLSDLFKVLPDAIRINMDAETNQEQVHEIDLSEDAAKYITTDYEVVIPLRFESLRLKYTESIAGLKEPLKKFSDNQDELLLELKTTVYNTIPIDLNLSVEGYDESHVRIAGVSSNEAPIRAGDGTAEPVLTEVLIRIVVEKDALPDLDILDLIIRGEALEEDGKEVSLREDQYVQLNQMKLRITGGITLNPDNF